MTISDTDYKAAVATNLVQHTSDIGDVMATLNNQAAVNPPQPLTDGTVRASGVLETQDTHTDELATHATSIGNIQANCFSPAGVSNGTLHWVFYLGAGDACHCLYYNGAWNDVNLGGVFASGFGCYLVNGIVYLYGTGTNSNVYQKTLNISTKVWSGWNDIGGKVSNLGQ